MHPSRIGFHLLCASTEQIDNDLTLPVLSPPRQSEPAPKATQTETSMSVGDALTFVGSTVLPPPRDQFYLWNVLITHIIMNLIFVRYFSIDNNCFFSLVHMIFFVKNFHSQSVIAKCNSSAHLYLLYYWHATYTMRHKLSSPSHLPFGIVVSNTLAPSPLQTC